MNTCIGFCLSVCWWFQVIGLWIWRPVGRCWTQSEVKVCWSCRETPTGDGWFSRQQCERAWRWQTGPWDRSRTARQRPSAICPPTGSRAQIRRPDWGGSTTTKHQRATNFRFNCLTLQVFITPLKNKQKLLLYAFNSDFFFSEFNFF